METVDILMNEAVEQGVFPGGVLSVSVDNSVVFEKAYGRMNFFSGDAMKTNTVFDLASLTKSLATAPAVMLLVQEGRLDLETKISSVLPVLEKSDKNEITVAQLLCHNSGLPDYKPYYEVLRGMPENERPKALKAMLVGEAIVNPIGEKVVYSDIGYMFLAWIIEEVSGTGIDSFVEKKIYEPLGIDELYYMLKGDVEPGLCAATEDCPWRKIVLEGEVHDDNAWIVGKACGHAGLFGTVKGISRLLTEYLDTFHGRIESPVFKKNVLRTFLTENKGTRRTPGFDMPSATGSSSGEYFSETSVGHLGFTGTSFWMDLEKRIVIVFLTNRVHPSRENIKIRQFRPIIHNEVMKWC
jgi:CubicO group peptidase (beta-lactamase class C family)